jgi:hypothetical protein
LLKINSVDGKLKLGPIHKMNLKEVEIIDNPALDPGKRKSSQLLL